MDLAVRFRESRIKAGLTKTALAKPEYTVSYITQIEKGLRRPSPKALEFFARQLGTSVDYLATGIPDGIREHLLYRLEQARVALRERREQDAEGFLSQVLQQAAEFGLDRLEALALALLGDALVPLGRVREAIDAYERALDGHLPERDRGIVVAALARAYRAVGDLSYAIDLVESFLAEREKGHLDPAVVAELQTVLVSIYFERGDIHRAERAAGRALTAADLGAPLEVRAQTYWGASRVMAEARRWEEALELATRARVIMEEMDDRRRAARLHNAYAFICLEAEPPRGEEAAFHLDQAERLLVDGSASGDLAYVFSERSRLALIQGRPDDALAHAQRALSEAGVDDLERARCLFLKGRALGALGSRGDAARTLQEAAAVFQKHGARQQEAVCWRELGELDLAAGDVNAAVAALRAGLRALDSRRSRA